MKASSKEEFNKAVAEGIRGVNEARLQEWKSEVVQYAKGTCNYADIRLATSRTRFNKDFSRKVRNVNDLSSDEPSEYGPKISLDLLYEYGTPALTWKTTRK